MMKDLNKAIGQLIEKSYADEVNEALLVIIKKWKEYEDAKHSPSDRKEFYKEICRGCISCLNKENDIDYQLKRRELASLPDFILDRFMYNIFSPSTCNREEEKIERKYKETITGYNNVKSLFQSILNRY